VVLDRGVQLLGTARIERAGDRRWPDRCHGVALPRSLLRSVEAECKGMAGQGGARVDSRRRASQLWGAGVDRRTGTQGDGHERSDTARALRRYRCYRHDGWRAKYKELFQQGYPMIPLLIKSGMGIRS
jgi:hypothetical protein